jgi:hypothetical protein
MSDEPSEPIGPGLYEFNLFNEMLRAAGDEGRADLHKSEIFDDSEALAGWISDCAGPEGLDEHLNAHLREHAVGEPLAAASWLAFRSTRDGQPVEFFLRVGVRLGVLVGRRDDVTTVVVGVPSDWPHLPPGEDVGAKGIVFSSDAVDLLRENYEAYERSAIAMLPGEFRPF